MSFKIKYFSFYDWFKYSSYSHLNVLSAHYTFVSNNVAVAAIPTQEHSLIINHAAWDTWMPLPHNKWVVLLSDLLASNMNMWSCLSGCSLKWWIGMNTACHGSSWHYSRIFLWPTICHCSGRGRDDRRQSNSPVSDIAVVFAPSLLDPSNSRDKIKIAGNVSRVCCNPRIPGLWSLIPQW